VADDDLGCRLVAKATVEALGHECVAAEDGTAAWAAYQAYRPDVLMSDREMPGMDGLALCRAVRAQADGASTYVILVTGHTDPREVLAAMRAGADDHLAKPLNPLDLQARLLAAERVTALHAELARARRLLAELG
jgi:two-component system chemotaxis response regulator CheY